MNSSQGKSGRAGVSETLKQGFQFLQSGEPDKAIDCCRRALQANQKLPEGHFLTGLVALELGHNKVAIEAFGSVTKLQPEHGAAWAQLARLFMLAGQPAHADAALAKARQYEDGNPTVQDMIGLAHTLLGEDQEALGWYEKAALAQPDNVVFRVNHANCQVYNGHLDEAESSLHAALELQPGNANAHWILSGLRKAVDRSHANELEQLIGTGRYPAKSLAFLYYALGKELEDLNEWDGAFSAFTNGASARRSTIEYDEPVEIEMYKALENTYTCAWMDAVAGSCDARAPIFVVGQPRTGTTLVERIITAHSQVHSAGELKQFGNAVRRLTRYAEPTRFSARLVEDAAQVDPAKLGKMYMETTRTMTGGAPRFVDKLPMNFIYVPLILKALPHAKIIHLRRNPMDACFSSFKQLFADAYLHSYEQTEMARHHARYYRLMDVWRERFGDRFFDVHYEDVARDTEPNARALIEFLELPWEDTCLEFYKQNTAVSTASAVQVRQPAHTKSIGRWRRYELQLAATRAQLEALGIPLETG